MLKKYLGMPKKSRTLGKMMRLKRKGVSTVVSSIKSTGEAKPGRKKKVCGDDYVLLLQLPCRLILTVLQSWRYFIIIHFLHHHL